MKLIQPSFAKGEIGPELYGRVDTRAYQIALRRARNTIVHQYGGISNRPGTLFLAPVKNHMLPPRLIPFQFKTTDTHVIELGNEYIRILRNDAHVMEAAKSIEAITAATPPVVTITAHGYATGDDVYISSVGGMTELNGQRFRVTVLSASTFSLRSVYTDDDIPGTGFGAYTAGGSTERIFTLATTYQQDELRDIQFTQSADVMTLVHPEHPPAELRRLAVNNWELVDIIFRPEIDFPTNAASSGGSDTIDSYYQITAIADNGEESLAATDNAPQVITGATQTNPVQITSVAHTAAVGDIIHIDEIIGMTELNNRRFTVSNVATDTFDLLGEDGTDYTPYASAGIFNKTAIFNTNSDNITLTWDAIPEAVRYRVFKKENGVFGFIASTDAPVFVVAGTETPDLGDTPPRLVEPFLGVDNRPRAVGYHQQRMVMGGSNNKPDTSYFSVVGNFHNFSHATPIRADDGFSATLASGQVNEIRHYTSIQDLIANTSGVEWAISGASGETRFSVDTIEQKPQTNWGANNMPPIVIGQTVLFAEETSNRLRAMNFRFEDNHYETEDLSLTIPHLMEGRQVVEWGYVKTPDPIIYIVRDDGQVLCLTYHEKQEVIAWTTWDTDGKFESVCTVRPSISSIHSEAYLVIMRKIDGLTQRFIERTHPRFFADVRDAFFVDCGLSLDVPYDITAITLGANITITAEGHPFVNGDEVDIFDVVWESDFDEWDNEVQPDQLNTLRYTIANVTANTFTIDADGTGFNAYREGGTVRKAVATVTGLNHLPSTAVVVLADGNVISNLTTSATGELDLPRKFSRVHVGLRYISDVQTLSPEVATSGLRTMQASLKQISKVDIIVKDTRGFWIGPDNEDLTELKWRTDENMDQPTALFTGTKEQIIPPTWKINGQLFIRQRDPIPMTILALVPDVFIGG